MSGDDAMRAYAATLPAPGFTDAVFTPLPKPLAEARVAIVTSAALHRPDDERFGQGDTTYRTLDRHDRELVLGHWSPNFDRTGFQLDLNVVYPIDRLEELAADGVIGQVAPRHFAFAGNPARHRVGAAPGHRTRLRRRPRRSPGARNRMRRSRSGSTWRPDTADGRRRCVVLRNGADSEHDHLQGLVRSPGGRRLQR